jgi:hypothetical protein
MAYPTIDAPYGLVPVGLIGGRNYAGGVREMKIANNVSIVSNTLTTANGRSKVAVLSTSAATTNTLPLKVLDVVEETKTGSDAFVELIVTYNPAHEASDVMTGGHSYRNPTGL